MTSSVNRHQDIWLVLLPRSATEVYFHEDVQIGYEGGNISWLLVCRIGICSNYIMVKHHC